MDEPGVSTANVRQVVPFFRTRDMDAALGFYVDGLGFTVTRRWEPDGRLRWCWIELGQGALMLQLVDATSEVPPGERPLGQGVLICLMCDDAIAIWREARRRGLSPERPAVGNGLWVTSFEDPDGHRLDFESPTEAAEDSRYDGD